MYRYLLGIGSNIEPALHVPRILSALASLADRIDISRVIETAPVQIERGGTFLNLCASLVSPAEPAILKARLNALEVALGRDRRDPDRKSRDRVADIDILACLPLSATELASGQLPAEPYLRPLLFELADYLGLAVPGKAPELPHGVLLPVPHPFGGEATSLRLDAEGLLAVERRAPDASISAAPAALVTGGAVRLGRALALALAARGYDIALHYRSSAQAAVATAEEVRGLGRRCGLFACDLAQASEIPELLARVHVGFPGLELLVNSASSYTQASIAETRLETFDRELATNLRAPFFLIQAFAARVEQGQVVNILDNKIAYNQFPYAAYLLAKKALAALTKMAALEFAPRIRVHGVAPGVVLPASSRSEEYVAWRIQGIPLKMQGSSQHIAQAVLACLDNPFQTGQIITVDGGESLEGVGRNASEFDQSKI